MTSSKNSMLIQQLCKHIAIIEELNVKLHERISAIDHEKEVVFRALGRKSWDELLADLSAEKNNLRSALQDTSSTNNSRLGWNAPENMDKTGLGFYQTPLKLDRNQSVFQSPIESQSRLINRSIRGDTDRNYIEELQEQYNRKQEKTLNENIITLRSQNINSKPQTDNFLLTLNNIATHSLSKQNFDLKNTEQQNMLLSIENTKLRQRVAKLQAIVSSRSYH